MKTGVYFLLKGRKVVYIGATRKFPIRFNMFNKDFDFDRTRLIECRSDVLFEYEVRWIKLFKPKYNITSKIASGMVGRPNPNAGNKPGNTRFKNMNIGDVVPHDREYHPSAIVKGYSKSLKEGAH